jgi:Concanavalin A-like lectin/glucanases superfamily
MRAITPTRIARSLVTVIFLTFIQVVAAPVLLPQYVSATAEANTFNSTGLILDWDVSNLASYNGSGTTMGDSSGNSSTGTFKKVGPTADFATYSAIEPKFLTFSGTSTNYNSVESGDLRSKLDNYPNDSAQNISIFTWVYPTGNGIIVDEFNQTYGWQDSQIEMADGRFSFRVWGSEELISEIATPLEYWYYVGLTYDFPSRTLKAYVNGQLVDEQFNLDRQAPWENNPASTLQYGVGRYDPTHLGSASGGNFRFGALHIFKTPLTQSVIEQNYRSMLNRFGPTVGNPANNSQFVNRSDTFSVTACAGIKSAVNCVYKWEVSSDGGSNWSTVGASSTSYGTPILQIADNGKRYRVTASDPGSGGNVPEAIRNFAVSNVATLSVIKQPGGETDTALTTSGTKYATLANSNPLIPGTISTMTLEAWVKPSATCDSATPCTIMSVEYSYLLQVYSGKVIYYIGSGGAWCDASAGKFPVDAKVPSGKWTHVALVRNGSNVKIFIDGQLRSDITSACNPTTQTANNYGFFVGARGLNYQPFPGSVDEVRIWNSDRSASVAGDMHSNETSTSGLLHYWNFNEGTGTAAYNDVSGALSTTDLTVTDSTIWDANVVSSGVMGSAYTTRTFFRSYITENGGWKVPDNVSSATVLVIAGGGGGGSRVGGGGGAGGFAYVPRVNLTPNTFEPIQVGQGGFGAQRPLVNEWRGQSGQGSSLGTKVQTVGGGGGAGYDTAGNNVEHDGKAGGSGGGASAYTTLGGTGTPGSATQISTYGYGSGNSGGSGSGQGHYPAGGGGGAGGAGATPVNNGTAAAGGAGVVDPIGGTNLCYAAGGGGGIGLGASGAGGAAGSCGVAYTTTATAGTKGRAIPADAMPNSGSGGGGAGYQTGSTADVAGGSGGSGVIIVRWITASKPIFTQPTNDTTTAGLTDTITVSNNPFSPLLRNFQWQRSIDTGTTWSNITTGSGITSNTYTTPILDTSTSGSRFQYRVIVTDSDTAGLFIVDTSTAVFIVINPPISISGSYTVQKYGQTHTDTFTAVTGTGTGNKTFTFTPNRAGLTWNGATANQATLTVASTLGPGTYLETMTATDTRGAQTSLAISVVVTKADTVTVTTLALADTYTGSALSFTPRFTVTGLLNSDTVTPITWSYQGADNAGTTYSISQTRPMNAGSYTISGAAPLALNDSYTAVRIETATLTINRATRTITMGALASPIKYGDTRTATATPSLGSGDGVITYATTTSDSCTVTSTTIRAVRPSGTCSFTATIARGNNFESATSTSPVTATLSRADTLTVRVSNPVTLTFTGSTAATLPTVTLVGLAHTDTGTVTRLYSAPASLPGAPETYTALVDSPSTPVDVESYTVGASFAFSSGASSNYLNVVVETSTLRINQANQDPLRIALYNAWVGSPFTILTEGGTGLGTFVETITAGSTAIGCQISARVLTMTSTTASSCNILVTKAATRNYRAETATATINFLLLVFNQPSPPAGSGPNVALTGENVVTIDVVGAPTISGISPSVISLGAGGSFIITGTGFGSIPVTVKFWRDKSVTITPADGSTIIVPVTDIAAANGQSGRITLINAGGTAVSVERLTINP